MAVGFLGVVPRGVAAPADLRRRREVELGLILPAVDADGSRDVILAVQDRRSAVGGDRHDGEASKDDDADHEHLSRAATGFEAVGDVPGEVGGAGPAGLGGIAAPYRRAGIRGREGRDPSLSFPAPGSYL